MNDCCSPCATQLPPTLVPGPEGTAGAAGTNGTNGVNAYTLTSAGMTVPVDTVTPVTISVGSSVWMAVGQILIIGQGTGVALTNPGPATFVVSAVPSSSSVTLLWKNAAGDVAAGTAISSGAVVSPCGTAATIAVPLPIASGGTNAITKAAAQTSLGLGQDAIVSSGNGLTQDITASLVQVGAIDLTIPALGTYFLRGNVSVELQGATFASSRAVTVEIRNVTQNVTLATMTRNTGLQTTVVLPSIDWELPFVNDATAAANDHIQMRIMVAVIPSAGAFKVIGGSLAAIPLRKT